MERIAGNKQAGIAVSPEISGDPDAKGWGIFFLKFFPPEQENRLNSLIERGEEECRRRKSCLQRGEIWRWGRDCLRGVKQRVPGKHLVCRGLSSEGLVSTQYAGCFRSGVNQFGGDLESLGGLEGELVDCFLTFDGDIRRGDDPQADAISANLQNADFNVVVDADRLIDLSGEN